MTLAQAGAMVGIHFHSNQAGAQNTLDSIQKAGGRAMILSGDLTRTKQTMLDEFSRVPATGCTFQ